MTTGAEVVAAGRKYLGITEDPRGSNCQQFSHRLGRPCERWCGDWVTCVYLDCGIDLRTILTPYTASTDALWAAGKKKGWTVAKSAALPGDFILCDFAPGGGPEHVEIVTKVSGGHLWSIGGNTGHGRLANGGMVYEQERSWSVVLAVVRVPGVNAPGAPPVAKPPKFNPVATKDTPVPVTSPLPIPDPDEDDEPMYLIIKTHVPSRDVFLSRGDSLTYLNGDMWRYYRDDRGLKATTVEVNAASWAYECATHRGNGDAIKAQYPA